VQTSKYRTPQASRRHIIAILKRHKTIGPEIPWIHGLVGRPKMALCRLMSPCARDCTLEAARITAKGGATEPLASVDNRRASARSPSAPHPAPPRVPPTRTPPRSLRTPRHAQRRAIHRGAHPPPRPGHRLDKRSSRGRACDGARPRAPTAKTAERKRDKPPHRAYRFEPHTPQLRQHSTPINIPGVDVRNTDPSARPVAARIAPIPDHPTHKLAATQPTVSIMIQLPSHHAECLNKLRPRGTVPSSSVKRQS
jgi:hypothetical protein